MKSSLVEAIDILKRLSEDEVERAVEILRGIKSEGDKEKKAIIPKCPDCGANHVVRNGHKGGKQAYICRECKKSFVETSKSTRFKSHYGEAVWKQVIRDTVNGIALDETAENLRMHHETVFNMRHKILHCLERDEKENPTQFEGICEMDETYILESSKGTKLSPDYWRKPRRHGEKAVKPGLSNEYICVCAGVGRDGQAFSKTVNRAMAGSEDIEMVFGDRISGKTVVIVDGQKGYEILQEDGKCAVLHVDEMKHSTGDSNFFNVNMVSNYHGFIKERHRNARGFATKYLNRYNALFSKTYRSTDVLVDDIYDLICKSVDRNYTIKETQTSDLLEI